MNMNMVLETVQYRTNRMVRFSRYFFKQPITWSAKNNFVLLVREGVKINNLLKYSLGISNSTRDSIENYFIQGEECVMAASVEAHDEYCPGIETFEELRDERLALMILIDNYLGN